MKAVAKRLCSLTSADGNRSGPAAARIGCRPLAGGFLSENQRLTALDGGAILPFVAATNRATLNGHVHAGAAVADAFAVEEVEAGAHDDRTAENGPAIGDFTEDEVA